MRVAPHRPPINSPSILPCIQFVFHNYFYNPFCSLVSPSKSRHAHYYTKMSMRTTKATMTELKLRRLIEHNHRLREELARPRVTVSVASMK